MPARRRFQCACVLYVLAASSAAPRAGTSHGDNATPLATAKAEEESSPFRKLVGGLARGSGSKESTTAIPVSKRADATREATENAGEQSNAVGVDAGSLTQSAPAPRATQNAAARAFGGLSAALDSPLGRLARTSILMVIGFQLLSSVVKESFEGPDSQAREALLRRCASTGLSPEVIPSLNRHELAVAADLVDTAALSVGFDDIAGMDDVKASAQELITDPWEFPSLYRSELLKRPTGILLYGPPGCGKTMLAKAIAKESGACCLAVSPSTLLRKYVGESNLMVRALFSLARKIQPCIIFVDEVDGIAYRRSDADATPVRDVSTEFMALWDGLQSGGAEKVVVLAATNRPFDLDPAAQRRFGRSFLVGLPDVAQRRGVLLKALREMPLEKGFDVNAIAAATEQYSCSDLVDLCREAMRAPLREVKARLRNAKNSMRLAHSTTATSPQFPSSNDNKPLNANAQLPSAERWREYARAAEFSGSGASELLRLRPLRTADVLEAQQRVVPSFVAAEGYRASLDAYTRSLVDQVS